MPSTLQLPRQRDRVRRLHRAEAAVAAAVVGRAERAAAGVGDRAEARRAVRDHDADVAAPLALHADARRRDVRPPAVEERRDHLEQLALVDRAAAQLEVDRDVRGDRRRGRERRDVLGRGVDDRDELVDVGEVAQRLDAARRRAGADRDELPRRRGAPAGSARRRAAVVTEPSTSDRSYGPSTVALRRLEEIGDLDLARERQQLVLAVEQRELAAVAGGELPDGELRLAASRSQLPHRQQRLELVVAVDGAVAADQRRAELAVAAVADAAAACCAPSRGRSAPAATPALEQRAARRSAS